MELENKTALITGAGATGGIGYETARQMAAEGAALVLTGRNQERGAAAAAALETEGAKVRFVLADLTNVEDVQQLAEAAGDVDILVNNAAALAFGPTLEQDVESFDESFDANVRGAFFLTAAVAKRMVAKGSGSIVNVSTMVAQIGQPGMSVYSATKAALESLTRTWAAEFAPAGIRVNAVAPGPTRTQKGIDTMVDAIDQLGAGTPLGRAASPSEIAEAIVFLASDRASYVTGATLAADGGRTAV
jgi:NAD(P)-dependent dehydrogenase (short-subunit alcohol dehydrogenase family)